jgi:RNA polymerase sigma-70 factor, ECF subfamily
MASAVSGRDRSPRGRRRGWQQMDNDDRHALFSQLIARHQSELYGYIFAIVRNWEDANDLFQSVCLVLWSKFEAFQPGTSFFAWARQTAKFEVRKFLARKPTPNRISAELLDSLAEITLTTENGAEVEFNMIALRRCREKLDAADEKLLELRYADGLTTVAIANRMQRMRQSVGRSLHRIRRWLLDCIEEELVRQKRSREDLL